METSRVLNASRGLPVEVRSNIELDIPTEGTFTEFVLQRAQQFGDRIALVDGDTGRSYSYSELRCNVIRCAAALYDVGVRRGDRVCVLLNNCVEFPIVMLAVMQLEAICVPTSYLCTKYELRDLVVDCSPFVYVTRSNQIDKLMYVTPLLSSKHVIITIDDVISAEETRDVMSLDSLLRSTTLDKHRQSVIETSNVADNRRLVALICYSSGTTGKPKGCMQTHHALIANGCMNKYGLTRVQGPSHTSYRREPDDKLTTYLRAGIRLSQHPYECVDLNSHTHACRDWHYIIVFTVLL